MKKLILLFLFLSFFLSCSMPELTDKDFFSGFPLDNLIHHHEIDHGPLLSLEGDYYSQCWWKYADYTDGTTAWYKNPSHPDEPDWTTVIVF